MISASLDLRKNNIDSFLLSLDALKKVGFDGVEIALWENMNKYSDIIKLQLESKGLGCNVHLGRLEGIGDYRTTLNSGLEFAKSVNASKIISHPLRPYADFKRETKKLFTEKGLPENLFVETIRNYSFRDNENLRRKLIIDTGNIFLNGEWALLKEYSLLSGNLIHIHDVVGQKDHFCLGSGVINVDEVTDLFKGADYTIEMGKVFREWKELEKDYVLSIDALRSSMIKNSSFGKNARLNHFKNLLKDEFFEKIIDLGCAEGYLIHNLLAEKKRGYDVSPKKLFNDVEYLQADFDKEYSIANGADLIVCSEVIEHVHKDKELLMNSFNSLKSGGKIFVSTINSNCGADKSEQDLKYGHLRRYDYNLKNILEKIGFKTLEFYGFRGRHYYDAKINGKEYNSERDVLKNAEISSGIIYFGVKQ